MQRVGFCLLISVFGVVSAGCSGGGGGGNNPPQAPRLSLAADPQVIEEGETTTLSWSSQNTVSCTAAGDWSGAKGLSGSETLGPLLADASFRLTCDGRAGSIPGSATESVTVSVTPRAVAQVILTLADPALAIGDTATPLLEILDGEGRPLPGRIVAWSSSDPAVASVDDNGSITAIAVGVAKIAADVENVSSTIQVTVSTLGTIAVLGDRLVQLSYPSLFDVFTEPDPERYPNIRVQPDYWESETILADLDTFVMIDAYDFVLVYTSQEVPEWINAGPNFYVPAKNIGRRNNKAGIRFSPYARLRSTPHMNWAQFAIDNELDPVLIAIHEMAHHWGVYMVRQSEIGPRNWVAGEHHVSYLASCCVHWTFAFSEGQIGQTDMPGMMGSGPTRPTFNEFDLYAMGLMDYEEASAFAYLIAPVPEPPTAPHEFHEINLDLLIEGMRISQPDNVAGDGKRIPAIEPEATQVTALVVLVNGESDAVSVAQTDKLHAIATELPDAWRLATWDRSHMTTDLVLQNN